MSAAWEASAIAASTAALVLLSSLSDAALIAAIDGSCSAAPVSTRVFGPSTCWGIPWRLVIVEPRPSSALPISLGTIHSLLAPPSAIFGIIWRYW